MFLAPSRRHRAAMHKSHTPAQIVALARDADGAILCIRIVIASPIATYGGKFPDTEEGLLMALAAAKQEAADHGAQLVDIISG